MNYRQLARHLIEKEHEEATDKVQIYADRVLLRLVDSPSLLAYLDDTVVLSIGGGKFKLQYKFEKLPDEVLPMLRQIFGKEVEVSEFSEESRELHGVEIELDLEDLGCDEDDE